MRAIHYRDDGTTTEPADSWRNHAACATVGDSFFFVDKGVPPTEAKLICNGDETRGVPPCPVQAECLQFALDLAEEHGIWGGLTPRERRNIRTTLTCAYCGGDYPKPTQPGPPRKYCSDEHAAAAHREQKLASYRRQAA